MGVEVARTVRAPEPFMAGYRTALAACQSTSVEMAWRLLEPYQHHDPGYLIGFRKGVWDYERTHDLVPSKPPANAFGSGTYRDQHAR